MNDSLLYQAYGVKDYSYASTEYKGNAIYLHLKTNSPKRCICPHCGGHHVIKYGIVKRTLHNLPFGTSHVICHSRYNATAARIVVRRGSQRYLLPMAR